MLGKVIYIELCNEKILFDAEAPEHLKNKFVKWVRDISSLKNEITRSIALNKDSITAVDLRVFCDAGIAASCAMFNAVVHQPSVTN